jgi:uncharacterized CHY-type Zn-finger protein
MNEKMAQHPDKKFKYDEKSRKMAVEGAAKRKLERNEKMAQHPDKKFKCDEKSRKMAVEGAAKRKLERLKYENDEVAHEDNVFDDDEAPEVD